MHASTGLHALQSSLSPRTPWKQHADLHQMLLRIVLAAGVEIRYGAKVSQVIPGEELPEDGLPHRSVNGSGSMRTSSPSCPCSDPATSASVTGCGPPSVRLVNGEVLTADIIIGADGSRSMVRELLLSPEQDHGVESGYAIYS